MKRVLLFLVVAAMVLALQPFSLVQAQEEGNARVRVVHASPDAPPVNVQVNGSPAFTDVPFGTVSDYTELPPATYNVSIEGAEDGTFLFSANLELQADMDYTVVAMGLAEDLSVQVYADDNALPEEGQSKVRFVHASPDAPAVDVAVRDGDTLFDSIEFGQASDYLTVDAGSYDLNVLAAGTEDVALEVPGVTLEPQTVATIFALGQVADQSLQAKLQVDTTPQMSATDQPAVESQTEEEQSATETQQAEEEQPAEGEQPADGAEAAAEEQPTEGEQPAEGEQTTEGAEAAAEEQPTEGEQPSEESQEPAMNQQQRGYYPPYYC
nr:DUF4397 domain-containing protein [Anaerolineae bacterium]